MTPRIALEAAWLVPALRSSSGAGSCRHQQSMNTENMALVQGWADTRDALRRWAARPGHVAAAVGARQPRDRAAAADADVGGRQGLDARPHRASTSPASTRPPTLGDFGFVLYRNGLVLALHGFACVAGFMAGSSLPQVAEGYSGVWRWIHDKAGPLAIGFVICATLFSLAHAGLRARQRRLDALARSSTSPPACCCSRSRCTRVPGALRALPPARRMDDREPPRSAWNELLAATFVTVAIAIPIVVAAAAVETWVTPGLLRWLAG